MYYLKYQANELFELLLLVYNCGKFNSFWLFCINSIRSNVDDVSFYLIDLFISIPLARVLRSAASLLCLSFLGHRRPNCIRLVLFQDRNEKYIFA